MGFTNEKCGKVASQDRQKMEKAPVIPFLTGTSLFIEELQKRTFKSGDEVMRIMTPETLTIDYLNKNGFNYPIVMHSSDGLNLMVPPFQNWSDFEAHVGSDRRIEVIDVEKQDPTIIDFSTFIRYMKKTKRHRVLNLLSLECSELSLGTMIEPPLIARELDWVTKFWPSNQDLARPKVQKYCLISPVNSYTDFHIDFGGTSVWYHIVKGEKIFYLIRPSEANKSLFWNWSESRNRLHTFFADQVDECFKYTLKAGSTLFLPTGWIHAVLTTEDSLVYGGNFLHTLNIEGQLAVYAMESKVLTPPRYLFPHFEDLHWLAAQGLVKELELFNTKNELAPQFLLQGLKAILVNLRQWFPSTKTKENAPKTKEVMRLFFDANEANDLLKEISKQIRNADRLIHLLNPPKPERNSTRMRKKPVRKDFIEYPCYRKKSPKRAIVDDPPPNSVSCQHTALTPNYYILNGGMKVILKRLTDAEIHPSTSSSERGGPSSASPKYVEVDSDFDNSLRIIDHSDIERSPRHHLEPATNEMQGFVVSKDSGLKKKFKVKRQRNSVATCNIPGVSNTQFESMSFAANNELSNDAFPFEEFHRTKKQRASSKVYKEDVNLAKNVVHQDDDYIYPSLELTDDESEENKPLQEKYDEAWSPKAKVGTVAPKTDRPSRIGKQKVAVGKGLEAAAASDYNVPEVPKVIIKKKKDAKTSKPPPFKVTLPDSSPSKNSNKSKKGFATPKQRLGKILKLYKLKR